MHSKEGEEGWYTKKTSRAEDLSFTHIFYSSTQQVTPPWAELLPPQNPPFFCVPQPAFERRDFLFRLSLPEGEISETAFFLYRDLMGLSPGTMRAILPLSSLKWDPTFFALKSGSPRSYDPLGFFLSTLVG